MHCTCLTAVFYHFYACIILLTFQEVILVRFSAVNDEEKVGYRAYFKYLSERRRFGVVGNGASVIKDMYVIPLPRDESLPSALKPYRHKGLCPIFPSLYK